MTPESRPAVEPSHTGMTLDTLRAQYPTWVIRQEPWLSATCTRQLAAGQHDQHPDLAMNVYADDLAELAIRLAEQERLRAKAGL